jgi:hypothetical protein
MKLKILLHRETVHTLSKKYDKSVSLTDSIDYKLKFNMFLRHLMNFDTENPETSKFLIVRSDDFYFTRISSYKTLFYGKSPQNLLTRGLAIDSCLNSL